MRIDIRKLGYGCCRFEVTYKSDNITITEDICGYSQVEELSEGLIQAVLDLSNGTPEYLNTVLNNIPEDEIIDFLVKSIGLQSLVDEIACQTDEVITINNEEEI